MRLFNSLLVAMACAAVRVGAAEQPQMPPVNPCGLGSENLANWVSVGETVSFTNALPDGGAMEGVVRDTAGKVVCRTGAVGRRWSWTPERTGFYTVRFTAVQDGERLPVRLVLNARTWVPEGRRGHFELLGSFPREEFGIAVSPCPPRPPKDAPDKFGFNVEIRKGNPRIDEGVQVARLVGMNAFLRLHHWGWNEIERRPGVYDWAPSDDAIRYLRDNGYDYDRLLINVFGTPDWLSTASPEKISSLWYQRPEFFAPREMAPVRSFYRSFCEHYRGIRHVEVWNEPHLPGYSVFWQDSTPEQFVDLLKHAYEGIKAADPTIEVVMGGIGMRYLPFYERAVPLGLTKWFDTLATHCGYDMRPFQEVERRYGQSPKPQWEDEWHTVLYNCSNPNPPSEEECAFRMLMNFACLLTADKTRITGFGSYCYGKTPESAHVYAGRKGIHQVSGLFRHDPMVEPRFAAFALRTATDLFAGDVRSLGAWRYGEDGRYYAIAQTSGRGDIAFVWTPQERTKQGVVPTAFREAAKDGRLLDWEGHETSFDAFAPRKMYYIVKPNLAALRSGVPADSIGFVTYNFKGYGKDPRATSGYGSAAQPTVFGTGGASFLPELDEEGLRLRLVLPAGESPVSLDFAIDAAGRGQLEDVLEFRVDPDGTIVKPRTPQLMGDIPSDYSPANVKLTRSRAEVKDGIWTISVWRGDLYPMAYSVGQKLAMSLILKTDRGAHVWGGGLGRLVEPGRFGLLLPSGGGKVLATTEAIDPHRPFGDAELVRTEAGGIRVRATSDLRGAGISLPVAYLPGSRIAYRGKIRGTVKHVGVGCWCSFGPGAGTERRNGPQIAVSDAWTDFSGTIEVPAQSASGTLNVFSWRKPDACWEIKDFELVND